VAVGGIGDDILLREKIRNKEGYLVSIGGPMGCQKTTAAVLAVYWATKSKGKCDMAYGFKPENSLREGIDADTSNIRSRSGIGLEGMVFDYDKPEQIATKLLERGQWVAVIDECHMTEGMSLRPVINALVDVHKIGIYTISLSKDFGNERIPISGWLDRKATVRYVPQRPFCDKPNCWELGDHNQLLQGGEPVDYSGFKVITGDKDPEKLEGLTYGVYCGAHYRTPKFVNYNRSQQTIPGIQPEEKRVIQALRDAKIIPRSYPEELLIR